ncbi:MAG TPA: hypothetical protein VNA69_24530 [Thermoanaerobaculia bacterium]|nr:hypothetical protein [Thermoanaerobaculia bacterium]
MHRLRIPLFCLIIAVVALPLFAANDRAAERAAFEKEWKEVVAKYPRVAEAYVVAMETSARSMQYIYYSNERAFAASAFWIYEDLCDGQGIEWTLCEQANKPVFDRGCRNCRLECAPPGSPHVVPGNTVECSNCRLRQTECQMGSKPKP